MEQTTSQAGKRILVVDDCQNNSFLLKAALKKLGAIVDIADCGLDAIKLSEDNNFDLILMDINMPFMDGIETANRIRSIKANANQCIIAVTASYTSSDRNTFISTGFDDFIAKPINLKSLYGVIEAVTQRTNSQQAEIRKAQTPFYDKTQIMNSAKRDRQKQRRQTVLQFVRVNITAAKNQIMHLVGL